MMSIWTALPVLAEAQQDPDELRSVIDKAGPIAGLFVLVLAIALFFLFRSMNRQMKKISPELPEGPDDREQALDRAYTQEAVARGESAESGESGEPGSAR